MNASAGRDLSWRGFLVVVAGYLVVLRVTGIVFGLDVDGDAAMPTAEAVARNFVIPIGATAVYAGAVVTWLGWWRQVLVGPALGAIRAGLHAGHRPGRHQLRPPRGPGRGPDPRRLCTGALVGFIEELMFRGIGVTTFRRSGFPEARVAPWSSVIFGAVHLQNAVGEGPQAIAQAVIVSTSGYFSYLCLRSGGVILVPRNGQPSMTTSAG